MADALEKLRVAKKSGREFFRSGSSCCDFRVVDFWRWSTSDLLSNATRGVLAEYIVARALEIPTDKEIRDEWASFDLQTPEGIKVEVKSAAYIQTWRQTRISRVSFKTPKTKVWDSESNSYGFEPKRHSDVYVFALFAQREKPLDPLNLDQWKFYALSTAKLNDRKSISLPALEKITLPVAYHEVSDAVRKVAKGD